MARHTNGVSCMKKSVKSLFLALYCFLEWVGINVPVESEMSNDNSLNFLDYSIDMKMINIDIRIPHTAGRFADIIRDFHSRELA